MTQHETKKELKQVFDKIADEFSETRSYPWKTVEEFLEDREGKTALDLACGNGRHLPHLSRNSDRVLGIDFSRKLLTDELHTDARNINIHLVCGDLNALPVETSSVDLALFIAGLHHLPSRKNRIDALNEVARVLRPQGNCLLSVWAIEHGRFDGVRDEIRDKNHDIYVPWNTSDGEKHNRYYHIYERNEFVDDIKESSLKLEKTWLDSGNYYAKTSGTKN